MMTVEKIIVVLEKSLQEPIERMEKLAGDASDRSFFRVFFKDDTKSGRRSAVVMSMPPWGGPGELPYVNVQRAMHNAGLPVPEIFFHDTENGVMVIEDFGDVMLEDAVAGRDRQTVLSLYKKAVDLLLDIQIDGTEKMDRSCIAFSLAFDVEKLMFELNFFYENALIRHIRAEISPRDERTIRDGFILISETLAAESRVMTHRDYHSRNLMVLERGEIGMVDFQDARMGPVQYDLASLLMDAYAALPDDIVSDLYEYYLDSYRSRTGRGFESEKFGVIYDYMVAQRSIKACGSFAYLDVVKGKNRYLKYFAPAIRKAGAAMKRHSELKPLLAALAVHVNELKEFV